MMAESFHNIETCQEYSGECRLITVTLQSWEASRNVNTGLQEGAIHW